MSDERREEFPHDRLTRIGNAMLKTLENHPEYDGQKVIVCVDDGDHGGIALHGYESEIEALDDLLAHVAAILRLHGADMRVASFEQLFGGSDN